MTAVPLAALLPPERVVSSLRASTREEVLRAVAKRLAAGCAIPADEIERALAAREALGSTGIGHGVAVPHARIDGLAAPVATFARLERPVDFAAIDERPVSMVCAMLLTNTELKALAAVARRLRQDGVLDRLRRAGDAGELHRVLVDES